MKSIENNYSAEFDNNSSDEFDASDNEDLSFTDENNYRLLYEDSVRRRTPAIKEKYFNLFASTIQEKIGNHVESTALENRQKVTWALLYENVIRKIVNPFVQERGRMLVTMEEINRRFGMILKDRDIDFKVVSKSVKTDDSYTRSRMKNLKNETRNYVPQLMNKIQTILLEKREHQAQDNTDPDIFSSFSPLQIHKRKASSSPTRVLLYKNRPKSLLLTNISNFQLNNGRKENKKGSVVEIPTKNSEALKHFKDKFETMKKRESARTFSINVLEKLSKVYENYDKANEVGEVNENESKNSKNSGKSKNVKSSEAKPKINERTSMSKENDLLADSNSAQLSERKKMEQKVLHSFSKIMKIPFETCPPQKYMTNNSEKLAYLDEFEKYKHFKKTTNQPLLGNPDQQNKFTELFHLIDFKELCTLTKEPNDMNEFYKRGKLLEFHKHMSQFHLKNINPLSSINNKS